jgi:hypothetical protein
MSLGTTRSVSEEPSEVTRISSVNRALVDRINGGAGEDMDEVEDRGDAGDNGAVDEASSPSSLAAGVSNMTISSTPNCTDFFATLFVVDWPFLL